MGVFILGWEKETNKKKKPYISISSKKLQKVLVPQKREDCIYNRVLRR